MRKYAVVLLLAMAGTCARAEFDPDIIPCTDDRCFFKETKRFISPKKYVSATKALDKLLNVGDSDGREP